MRKILIALAIILICAVGLAAVETSVTFFPLTLSQQFRNRVTWTIAFTAPLIQVEATNYTPAAGDTHPSTPACHTLRATLAATVARNPDSYAPIFAAHLVTSGNVTGAGALTGSLAAGTLDTPATDAALFSAVSAQWSTVAGCITNP